MFKILKELCPQDDIVLQMDNLTRRWKKCAVFCVIVARLRIFVRLWEIDTTRHMKKEKERN